MNVPRANHAAIVLITGDVLVTGGLTTGGGYSDSAEIYSVSSQQWTLLPASIGTGLAGQAMALLSDGNVLIAGGTSTTKVVGSIVLFNLTDKTFHAHRHVADAAHQRRSSRHAGWPGSDCGRRRH